MADKRAEDAQASFSPHAARRRQWRGLAELDRDPRQTSPEFLPGVDEPPDEQGRRDFMRLMGASVALAGLGGCSRAPRETIRAYARQPPEGMPGIARRYATAMTIDGYARGLVVESHEGHPTKAAGNPDHPSSLGASSALEQASVLSLYDPDRPRAPMREGQPATWEDLVAVVAARATRERGRGVQFVLEPTGSPHIADQIARIRARLPEAEFHFHAAIDRRAAWEGARLALGRPLETHVALREADVILSLDADFMGSGPASLRLSREAAARRALASATDAMSRIYVAEPVLSVTGTMADHRLRVRARDVLGVAATIFAEVAARADGGARELVRALDAIRARVPTHEKWTRAVARDLDLHRGRSVVIAGDTQPAIVHALAHAMNDALGNVGRTVAYAESPILDAGLASHDLAPLAEALHRGDVAMLVVLAGNPAYTAPADLDFAKAIGAAKESVYLAPHVNETARAVRWVVPGAHYLEAWGDARAIDGTISIIQPLVTPLFGGRCASEILALFLDQAGMSPHDLLTEFWRRTRADFESIWEATLDRGLLEGSASPAIAAPPVDWGRLREHVASLSLASVAADPSLEIVFRSDSRVHDGAMTNNAWLLELPDPLTKLTWGNAALVAPATASRLGIDDGDLLTLTLDGRRIEAPALIAPGQADDAIAITFGYGKRGEERLARGVGANAYALRTSRSGYFAEPLHVSRTGRRQELAITQLHHALEGRDDDVLLHATLDAYRRDPRFARDKARRPLTLYASSPSAPRQWGMVIDLNACTGCSACVVACQAENNVPVVGKRGVQKGREMHWLRIDRYFIGSAEEPEALVEPMLCQHCEKAPCEYVCPVNATTHSADGLNQMVYNRCVGTRFCSNNCPYKVRRFNWFNYHQDEAAIVSLAHNPDVSVRSRGVMEKCTYCVQRIREAEIRAQIDARPLRDGDVVTACEEACPTRAIVFGDIRDPGSRVAKLRDNDRLFGVLDDLGNAPRTRYLARIRNPNPEIA